MQNIVTDPTEEAKHRDVDCTNILKLALDYLPLYKAKLEDCKISKEYETQSGEKAFACGQDKLCILEWLQTLLRLKDSAVTKKIEEIELPKLLLSLLKTYHMSSSMHIKIYNAFHDALTSNIESFIEAVFCLSFFIYEQ